jgi:photosystem II stability/assembly factor-like uncharacterized protein
MVVARSGKRAQTKGEIQMKRSGGDRVRGAALAKAPLEILVAVVLALAVFSARAQREWGGVAVSGDGNTFVAAGGLQGNDSLDAIFVSTNRGGSWFVATAGSNSWSSVACSVDGQTIVASSRPRAVGSSGYVVVSRDHGLTWTNTGLPSAVWISVCCSSDGSKMFAAQLLSSVYTSSDAGNTWSQTSLSTATDTAVACSGDGGVLAVSGRDGTVTVSSDGGNTWLTTTLAAGSDFSSVAISADGSTLMTGVFNFYAPAIGSLYVSTNTGGSWTTENFQTNSWTSVGMSADGRHLFAAGALLMAISADGGGAWTNLPSPILGEALVAQSSNGSVVVLAGSQSGQLVISLDGGLSWRRPANLPPSWVGTAPAYFSNGGAVSADASVLAAVGLYSISISRDQGMSWIDTGAPARDWRAVACSANGAVLAAVSRGAVSNAIIAISTNTGATWSISATPAYPWQSIACSADGSRLLAAPESGPIVVSSDGGKSWQISGAPPRFWSSVAMSADGSVCLGASPAAPIMISRDGGVTWTNTAASPTAWTGVACSADGRVIVGCSSRGLRGRLEGIYVSRDGGATWVNTNSISLAWSSVACSADGQRIVGLIGYNTSLGILQPGYALSLDSGKTWSSGGIHDSSYIGESVACSADGGFLFANTSDQGYTYQNPVAPRLDFALTNGGAVINWPIPSTPYVLQQSSDLASGDWTEVAASPNLNTTNIQYQVVLPANAVAGATFYRLQSR